MNNDLDVGDVRQRVERDVAYGPDSSEHEQSHSGKYEEAVVRAPLNDPADHLHSSRGVNTDLFARKQLPVL